MPNLKVNVQQLLDGTKGEKWRASLREASVDYADARRASQDCGPANGFGGDTEHTVKIASQNVGFKEIRR